MATDSLVVQKEFGQGVNRSTATHTGSESLASRDLQLSPTGNKYK